MLDQTDYFMQMKSVLIYFIILLFENKICV